MRAGAPSFQAGKDKVTLSVQSVVSGTPSDPLTHATGNLMNTIIYIVGLIVVVGFILSFFGLR